MSITEIYIIALNKCISELDDVSISISRYKEIKNTINEINATVKYLEDDKDKKIIISLINNSKKIIDDLIN